MILQNLKREDYTLTFESQGGNLLFEYIVNALYTPYASMAQAKGAWAKEYMPNSAIGRMHEEGLERTAEQTRKAVEAAEKIMGESVEPFEQVLAVQTLRGQDVASAFEVLKNLCEVYSYFDSLYWDGVYERSTKEDKEITELVEQNKNVLRDKFNAFFFGETSYLIRLLDKLSLQSGVARGDLEYYAIEELVAVCDGKQVPAEEVAARKKAYIVFKNDIGDISVLSGDATLDLIKNFEVEPQKTESITGKTAHKTGQLVRAKVRIIERDYTNAAKMQADMAAMQQGEVLVTQTTDPEMMPALRKASAAITDIGGLLSHTAITARELNIPCIVDTKHATRVLKTGDMVEVDAEKGIVKKI